MRKFYALLFLVGMLVAAGVALFQPSPGYMDADYYFAGGVRLAEGHGFSEMVLWNYLDNPISLPHGSHAYWMPLASILAALGMGLTRTVSLSAARLGFLLIAAFIPPLTAFLSYSMTNRRDLALAAGFFAVFCGYYVPYISTTDTFGIYMLLGLIFMLLVGFGLAHAEFRWRLGVSIGLGVIAGLIHLSRADGVLWFVMAVLAVLFLPKSNVKLRLVSLAFVILGYALIMAPWFSRNMVEFGTPLAPGGNRVLWLTSYDQTFSYPAGKLTFTAWLESGWSSIVNARLDALKWNLQTAWAVQGMIFLLPFVLTGVWIYRRDLRVQIGAIAWSLTFAVMTLVFPFAGSRGGFLHSGAALQPLWWTLAPVGFDRLINWAEAKRGWKKGQALKVFLVGFIGIALMMSGILFYERVFAQPGWGYESAHYRRVESFIEQSRASAADVVMVGNPPGYFIASDRPAIAVPNENLDTALELAERFGARFLILEKDGTPQPLQEVYDNPTSFSSIQYLGEIDGARIFAIP